MVITCRLPRIRDVAFTMLLIVLYGVLRDLRCIRMRMRQLGNWTRIVALTDAEARLDATLALPYPTSEHTNHPTGIDTVYIGIKYG